VHLDWSEDDERFRAELCAFLDARTPSEAASGFDFQGELSGGGGIPQWLRDWQGELFDNGWMIPGYPPEFGGRNCSTSQTLIYLEELARRRIPRATHFPGYAIVAPSLLEYGNDEQRQLVPAAIRGDTIWCIGMSEPNAGSDLAALRTRADRHGDAFIVNGQKVWTSYATVASKCFCYVRTDPQAPKHRGISLLIIDMDTPGIEVRPLTNIVGQADFAEVFFTDVEVPAHNLVGDLNGGWAITQGSLAHERAGLWVDGVARLEQTVHQLVELAARTGNDHDAGVRRQIASMYETASSLRSLGYKGFASFAQGSSAPEHSYMKMASSEAGKAAFELGMELLDAYGAVTDDPSGDEHFDVGRWVTNFYVSFANTIAGGSSEIQRNIIAQRVLGLPRG
jgi:alkylation response protein AidB-like acyl-CoA dehydrogenase